ncbi:MAG: AzlD domain-containing protein [Pseudomonadota bacterium]
MTGWSDAAIWGTIAALGVGTWLVRFSFLGLLAGRDVPAWILRHLRYTPVAVIPALVGPLVVWPEATGGTPEPARLAAAAVTIAIGLWSRSLLAAASAGLATLFVGLAVL